VGLLVASLLVLVVAVVQPDQWSHRVAVFSPAYNSISLGVALFATVVSALTLRAALPGTLARRRARAYFIAFLLNDASITASALGGLTKGLPKHVGQDIVGPLLGIVFAVLLARALLREQLFDFDLKVKWTIRRGTVAAIFVGVFLIATAIAEQYLQKYGVLVGGLAIGAMAFGMRPIERLAGSLADKAMPRVDDSAEYRTVRKQEVYRAAMEGALADGDMNTKERGMLATLAEQLGIGPKEMHAIERDVRTQLGVA
jgi:hypothetical protein